MAALAVYGGALACSASHGGMSPDGRADSGPASSDAGPFDPDAGHALSVPPSRCGLAEPLDLDGDRVPLVLERLLPVDGLAGGRGTQRSMSAGGGSTLIAKRCLRDADSACQPVVVWVDETGVHTFEAPLAPFPDALPDAEDEVAHRVGSEGTGWLLRNGRVLEGEDTWRWQLWAFRCGRVELLAEGNLTGSRRRAALLGDGPDGSVWVQLDRGAGGTDLLAIDETGHHPLVDDGERLLHFEERSGGVVVWVERGEKQLLRAFGPDGRVAIVEGRTVGRPAAGDWVCAAQAGGSLTLVRPTTRGASARFDLAGPEGDALSCASAVLAPNPERPDDLWLLTSAPDGAPTLHHHAPERGVTPVAGAPPVLPAVFAPEGVYLVGSTGAGPEPHADVWFVPSDRDVARRIWSEAPPSVQLVRRDRVLLAHALAEPGVVPRTELVALLGSEGLIRRWSFDEPSEVVDLRDGRPYVLLRGNAPWRLLALEPASPSPIAVLDLPFPVARTVSVGRESPMLFLTRDDGYQLHAIDADYEPTLLAEGLRHAPAALDVADWVLDLPWVELPTEGRGQRVLAPLSDGRDALEATRRLDEFVTYLDGTGAPVLHVYGGAMPAIHRVEGRALRQINPAPLAAGRTLSIQLTSTMDTRSNAGIFWLWSTPEDETLPSVLCSLSPGPAACEVEPDGVRPVRYQERSAEGPIDRPLAVASTEGRLHALVIDPTDEARLALFRTRPRPPD